MILTEEEAKAKRCQESFGDGWTTPDGKMATFGGAAQGQALVASPYFCIGSACMAWRWKGWNSAKYPSIYEAQEKDAGPDPTRYGFCGKAGRP